MERTVNGMKNEMIICPICGRKKNILTWEGDLRGVIVGFKQATWPVARYLISYRGVYLILICNY